MTPSSIDLCCSATPWRTWRSSFLFKEERERERVRVVLVQICTRTNEENEGKEREKYLSISSKLVYSSLKKISRTNLHCLH